MSSSDLSESFEEQEEAEEEEEEEDNHSSNANETRILSFEEAGQCLDLLGKDQSGLRYAYLLMAPVGRNLIDISVITEFKHVLYVNISNNKLTTENIRCLEQLPFLLSLQCDSNLIESGDIGVLKYLQIFTLNSNVIQSAAGIRQPQLERLELNCNKITDITELNGHHVPNLKVLEACYNSIQIIPPINFASLDSLFLAYNKIKRIIDLSKLVNLRVLHLRSNIITRLRGFSSKMKKLKYINLRDNLIGKITRFQKLRCLPNLETLIFLGNPIMSQEMPEEEEISQEESSVNVRIQLLRILPNLKRINKDAVTAEEQQQAKDYEEEIGEFIEFEESADLSTPTRHGSLVSLFEEEQQPYNVDAESDILSERDQETAMLEGDETSSTKSDYT